MKLDKSHSVTVVKKMRDYSEEPVFKKKAEKAIAFLKKMVYQKHSGRKANKQLFIKFSIKPSYQSWVF